MRWIWKEKKKSPFYTFTWNEVVFFSEFGFANIIIWFLDAKLITTHSHTGIQRTRERERENDCLHISEARILERNKNSIRFKGRINCSDSYSINTLKTHTRGNINTFINTSINNAWNTLVTSDPLAFVQNSRTSCHERIMKHRSIFGLGNSFTLLFDLAIVSANMHVSDGKNGNGTTEDQMFDVLLQ